MFTYDLNKFYKDHFSAIVLTIYFAAYGIAMYFDCRQYAYYSWLILAFIAMYQDYKHHEFSGYLAFGVFATSFLNMFFKIIFFLTAFSSFSLFLTYLFLYAFRKDTPTINETFMSIAVCMHMDCFTYSVIILIPPLVDVIVSITNPELREKYPGRIIYYLPSLIFATITIYLFSIYLTVTTEQSLINYIYPFYF